MTRTQTPFTCNNLQIFSPSSSPPTGRNQFSELKCPNLNKNQTSRAKNSQKINPSQSVNSPSLLVTPNQKKQLRVSSPSSAAMTSPHRQQTLSSGRRFSSVSRRAPFAVNDFSALEQYRKFVSALVTMQFYAILAVIILQKRQKPH